MIVWAVRSVRGPRMARSRCFRRLWSASIRIVREAFDVFLAQLNGFAVLSLVAPRDGLPRYTNGSSGGYVERCSFRAQVPHDCAEDVGADPLASAYEAKLPDDLATAEEPLRAKPTGQEV